MIKLLAGSAWVILGLAAIPSAGRAETRAETVSPIFGSAAVVPTTPAQNKSILGKGYYADMYGSWGIDYADYALYYGSYGYYNDAASYAYSAYQAFSAAAYYQAYDQ